MGMTPAVALTTQSLEPVQAFADASSTAITGWTVTAGSSTPYTGSAIAIVPTVTTTADSQSVNSNDYEVTVSGESATQDSSTKAWSATQAGIYTITVTKPGNGSDVAAQSATVEFEITKVALASNLITNPNDFKAGVSTADLADNIKVAPSAGGAASSLSSNNISVSVKEGSDLSTAGSQTVVLKAGEGSNYSGELELTLTIQANATLSDFPVSASQIASCAYLELETISGSDTLAFTPAAIEAKQNEKVYAGQGNGQVPAASALYVKAKYGTSASNYTEGLITLDDTCTIEVIDGTGTNKGIATEKKAVNAGTYGISVTIPYKQGTADATTVSTSLNDCFVISPAELTPVVTGAIIPGMTQAETEKVFATTTLQGADQPGQVYSVVTSAGNGANGVTAAGDTITGTYSLVTSPSASVTTPLGSNYALTKNTETATVQNAVVINGETYTVELAANGQSNAITGSDLSALPGGMNFAYSYNAAPQTPKVVFTNTNPESENKTPASGYTVLYGAWDVTANDYAEGDATVPTEEGQYEVSLQVGTGATAKVIPLGKFAITKANITNRDQVIINWNGQPVNGLSGNINVSGGAGDLLAPLTVVYAVSGITVPNGGNGYKVTQTATPGVYEINPNDAAGTTTNLKGGPISLTISTANYQIGSAAMSTSFLTKKPTYTAAAITASTLGLTDTQALVVKNSRGVVVPEKSVYYSTSGNAGTFTNPSNKAVSDLGTAGPNGVYTGTETINNVPTLVYYKELTNWTATYTNNTNAGAATVTITGNNNYAGQAIANFNIAPRNVADLTLTVVTPAAGFEYNTLDQTPDVKVAGSPTTVSGLNQTVSLEDNQSKDFTVSYSNNKNASTDTAKAEATITAASSNYTGSKSQEFTIAKYDISDGSTSAANLAFTTNEAAYPADILSVVSGLEVKHSPVPMVEGTDYTVTQRTDKTPVNISSTTTDGNQQQALSYEIVGKGNYEGTLPGTYYVTKTPVTKYIKEIGGAVVNFNGKAQTPNIPITLEGTGGVLGNATNQSHEDYMAALKAKGLTITYANNRNASNQATFTISASGAAGTGSSAVAYYGSLPTRNFIIEPSDLTDATFAYLYPEEMSDFSYTGSPIEPPVATDAKSTAGQIANGQPRGVIKTQLGTVINFEDIKGEYNVSYGANTLVTDTAAKTNYGTITVASTSANMKNAATEKFVITAAQIKDSDIKGEKNRGVYKVQADGIKYAEPDITVVVNKRTLVRDVDYTLTVSKGQKPGQTSSWVVSGIGNYTGQVSGTFMVVDDIANATITMPTTNYVYDGTKKEPQPTITTKSGNQTTALELATDYTLVYENNINAGTATVVISGIGNWGGEVKKTFQIAQAEGTLDITGSITNYTYTGTAATPEPEFTFTVGTTVYKKADLEAGTDYKYVYANNIISKAVSGKDATVAVEMLGNYGTKTPVVKSFVIEQADVKDADVVVGDVVVGKTPKVAVSMGGRALVEGTDFTFAADTKTPGTKTATIAGKGNYTGTQKVTFTVLNENQVPADDADLNGGTWKKTNGVWQYTTKDGKLVSSGWAKINGQYYYFDSKGNAKTGWFDDNGTWYYLNKAGEGTECAMVSNAWKKINGNWYHFAKSGAMQTGWQKINGAWYYLNKKGEGTEGAMRTGWQKINGAWYYLNKAGQGTEGAMKTGWFNDNGTWYYLNANGDMVSNQWKQINGSWFYFYASGAMAANTWVGNYWVDANGYWVR